MPWGPGELSPQHPDGDGQNAASMLEAGEAPGVAGAAWAHPNGGNLTPPGTLNWANWSGGCCPFPLLYNLANLPLGCGAGRWFPSPWLCAWSRNSATAGRCLARGDARLGAPRLGPAGSPGSRDLPAYLCLSSPPPANLIKSHSDSFERKCHPSTQLHFN